MLLSAYYLTTIIFFCLKLQAAETAGGSLLIIMKVLRLLLDSRCCFLALLHISIICIVKSDCDFVGRVDFQ